MNRGTPVIAGLGILVIGFGVGIWIDPSLARTTGIVTLFELVANTYVLIGGLASLAVMLALFIGMTAILSGEKTTVMPSVEDFTTTDQPGDEFETAVAELVGHHGRAVRPTEHRELIETRLREDAVRTIARIDGCDTATAQGRVSSGAWTQDRYAAAFVSEDVAGPKWWQVLRDWLVRVDAFERSALRTAEAIANYDARTARPDADKGTGGKEKT